MERTIQKQFERSASGGGSFGLQSNIGLQWNGTKNPDSIGSKECTPNWQQFRYIQFKMQQYRRTPTEQVIAELQLFKKLNNLQKHS